LVAVSASIAAWHLGLITALAETFGVDVVLVLGLADVVALDAEDEAALLAEAAVTAAPVTEALGAVGVSVTVTVTVAVAVSVTVSVTVAVGLISGMQSETKIGSCVSTVVTPACSAVMASVAALTAAAGSVAPPPPGPPGPPPEGVPVLEGAPLEAPELVPVVALDVDVVAALVLLVLEDEAYVCWSVWYWEIADLYAASAARTAFCSGVALIDASAWPAATVSPALTLTAVTVPLVGKLTLDCVT
jgi:hypothetical protein